MSGSEGEGADWRAQPDMHPWHFIAEELLARGWSMEDLAIRMAMPDYDAHIHEIGVNVLTLDLYRYVGPTDPRCTIGEESGRAIARAFGVHEDMIINLDREWRERAKASSTSTHPAISEPDRRSDRSPPFHGGRGV